MIDLTSLLIFLFLFLFGRPRQKNLRLRRFKSDRDEIWQDCSSSKCALTDGSPIWRHTFKMAATTSFRATKCCHLVWQHEASACVRQFVIYSFPYLLVFSTVHPKILPLYHPSLICFFHSVENKDFQNFRIRPQLEVLYGINFILFGFRFVLFSTIYGE